MGHPWWGTLYWRTYWGYVLSGEMWTVSFNRAVRVSCLLTNQRDCLPRAYSFLPPWETFYVFNKVNKLALVLFQTDWCLVVKTAFSCSGIKNNHFLRWSKIYITPREYAEKFPQYFPTLLLQNMFMRSCWEITPKNNAKEDIFTSNENEICKKVFGKSNFWNFFKFQRLTK